MRRIDGIVALASRRYLITVATLPRPGRYHRDLRSYGNSDHHLVGIIIYVHHQLSAHSWHRHSFVSRHYSAVQLISLITLIFIYLNRRALVFCRRIINLLRSFRSKWSKWSRFINSDAHLVRGIITGFSNFALKYYLKIDRAVVILRATT